MSGRLQQVIAQYIQIGIETNESKEQRRRIQDFVRRYPFGGDMKREQCRRKQ